MGKTSYDKIYDLLLATEECQSLMADVKKSVLNVKLERVTFRLGSYPKHHAVPQFVLSCDATWDDKPGDLTAMCFLLRGDVNKVIDACYGPEKKVKTRNCNRSIVRDGGKVQTKVDGYRESRYQRSFYEWLCNDISEEFEDVLKEARRRLVAEIKVLQQTEEYAKSRHEALVAFCKDTITEALLPWNHMSEQVLNDAWDQFICAAAMVE